jgi:hypothetical protein
VKQRQASRERVIIQGSSFDGPQLRKPLFNRCSFGGILLAGAVSWITGCANVTFHSDAALTQRTGLKFFTAKPYLLIGPTGNKDAPVKAEIISLPDLEHPTYAVYHPGWGSHNFSLAVGSNGTLSSYGQTADSKGPETISALTGALTSAATLTNAVKAAPLYTPSPNLYIDGAITELSTIGKMPLDKNHVVESKAKAADEIAGDLREWLQAPNGAKKLLAISNKIDDARIKDAAGSELATAINSHFDQARVNIGDAIKLLQEPTQVPPTPFQLFEIRMEAGRTTLVPADVRLAQAAIRDWSK